MVMFQKGQHLFGVLCKKKKKNAILSNNVGGGAFLHVAREHTLAPADLKETCQGVGPVPRAPTQETFAGSWGPEVSGLFQNMI